MHSIEINGRTIGKEFPPFIIAELSGNHNGSIDRAIKLINEAKASGADAIKLQTYTPDTMTIKCNFNDFQIKKGPWKGYTLYELYKEAQTPFEWQKELFEYAKKIDITIFSTPFDESAVDLLEDLNTPAYKIASFEVIDIPLISYVASTKKPIIISVGMATELEISEALDAIYSAGCSDVALLHCISSYPAKTSEFNLRNIPELEDRFGTVVGVSDHTLENTVSIGAISLGASIVEKHLTINRLEKGPDSAFSIEPHELNDLCKQVKDVWESLGNVKFGASKSELDSIIFRRSLYFVKDLTEGQQIQASDIRRIRPGYGLPPKMESEIIGKKLTSNVTRGTAVKMEHLG